MNSLAKFAIDAHGGMDRWKQFQTVSADLVKSGVLSQVKGQAGALDKTNVTVGLRSEWPSHSPFGTAGRRSKFEPGRVALEAADRAIVEELREPRQSFTGHTLETSWTELQLAYFVGCAMWTYLNMPFLLAWPGVVSEEMSPWEENGENWRRLAVHFPDSIAHPQLQANPLYRVRILETPRLRCRYRRRHAGRTLYRRLHRRVRHQISHSTAHIRSSARRERQPPIR
jgi:hypothetical protein